MGEGEMPKFTGNNAGAVIWVRIGGGLKTDEQFTEWRHHFEEATDEIQATPDSIKVNVAGSDGAVSLAAHAPWDKPEILEPTPTRAVLELNGQNIGGGILQSGRDRGAN